MSQPPFKGLRQGGLNSGPGPSIKGFSHHFPYEIIAVSRSQEVSWISRVFQPFGPRVLLTRMLCSHNKWTTVDGSSYCWWFRNPAFTSWGKGSLSHYLQGFLHPRWWISSINRRKSFNVHMVFVVFCFERSITINIYIYVYIYIYYMIHDCQWFCWCCRNQATPIWHA